MLGLTRGAMEVYGKPARYAPERVGAEFARHASWFAISSVGAMIVFLCVPLVVPTAYVPVALGLATVAFVSPFTEGGVCITLLLTRLPYRGGWLYAADLLGAAVGCLGVIFILPRGHLHTAGDRSRQRHAVDRRLRGGCRLDGDTQQR